MAMSSKSSSNQRLFRYPEPVHGPNVPYSERDKTPGLRIYGIFLVLAALLVECSAFIRKRVWNDTGFGSLRKIWRHIALTEPRYDPTVFPLNQSSSPGEDDGCSGESAVKDDVLAESSMITSATRTNSVTHYRSLYLSGTLTPLDVVRTILPLVRRDIVPPGEHSAAWFQVDADLVLKAAAASTARYQQKRSLGPLDGVPTAIKDEFDLDGYATTLGSVNDFTENSPRDEKDGKIDSWCVRLLEEAGAIILGKLSMNEYGMDTAGFNIKYGTPRNPYNQDYYTGGSSSGSAYAVAAGLVPISLGSDGGGSIRIPASLLRLWSQAHPRKSIHPPDPEPQVSTHHSSTDGNTAAVIGPMAADMRSLVAMYSVLSDPHPSSGFQRSSKRTKFNYMPDRKKVIGIPEKWLQRATPAVCQLCLDTVQWLVDHKGYTAVSIEIPFVDEGQTAHALTVLADAAALLQGTTRGLAPTNRILLALGRETPAGDYVLAQKLRHVLMRHLAWLWQQHPGMIIVTPTTACAGWVIRSQHELNYGISDGDQTMRTMKYVWLANLCGKPSISIPAGFVVPEGQTNAGEIAGPGVRGRVPIGLMGTGHWCSEENLLQFGLDAEEAVRDKQCQPPIWVDIVALAKDEKSKLNGGQE